MSEKEYIESGIIEQYVLGLCTAQEKAELEALRLTDNVLHQAIISFEIKFENVMMQHITLPNLNTDTKILNSLTTIKTKPTATFNKVTAYTNKNNWLLPIAAVSFLLLIISSVFNYLQYSQNKLQQNQLQAIHKNTTTSLPLSDFNILKNPSITPIAMYGVGYHSICRCTMFWDKKENKVYIMIHHLPFSSTAQDFQLWANVAGKSVNVGVINDAIRDRFIELPSVPVNATSFIVTLENAGGAAQPTLDETYLKGVI